MKQELSNAIWSALLSGFLLGVSLMLFNIDAVRGAFPWTGVLVLSFAGLALWRADKHYRAVSSSFE